MARHIINDREIELAHFSELFYQKKYFNDLRFGVDLPDACRIVLAEKYELSKKNQTAENNLFVELESILLDVTKNKEWAKLKNCMIQTTDRSLCGGLISRSLYGYSNETVAIMNAKDSVDFLQKMPHPSELYNKKDKHDFELRCDSLDKMIWYLPQFKNEKERSAIEKIILQRLHGDLSDKDLRERLILLEISKDNTDKIIDELNYVALPAAKKITDYVKSLDASYGSDKNNVIVEQAPLLCDSPAWAKILIQFLSVDHKNGLICKK